MKPKEQKDKGGIMADNKIRKQIEDLDLKRYNSEITLNEFIDEIVKIIEDESTKRNEV